MSLDDALQSLPVGCRDTARALLAAAWQRPVLSLEPVGAVRAWGLAPAPGAEPMVLPDSPLLDELDVLHVAVDLGHRKSGLLGMEALCSSLWPWCQARRAGWARVVARVALDNASRRALTDLLMPAEWRLRDAVGRFIWSRSLQGWLSPPASLGSAHPLVSLLCRWVWAPGQAARRLQRRQLLLRAGGLMPLLFAGLPLANGTPLGVLKALARELHRQQGQPRLRRLYRLVAHELQLPPCAIRRVAGMRCQDVLGVDEAEWADLYGLCRQLPAAAWPPGLEPLRAAVRCLAGLEGLLNFGMPEGLRPLQPELPPRVRQWLLRELRLRHGGDWCVFARALDGHEPRHLLLRWVLPRLDRSWRNAHAHASEHQLRDSAAWRLASPDWWLLKLHQWQADQHRDRPRAPRRRELFWQPLFAEAVAAGKRRVQCLWTIDTVLPALERFSALHLRQFLGPSLIGHVQWLLLYGPGDVQPSSLAVLQAEYPAGALKVSVVWHAAHERRPADPDCIDALQALCERWRSSGWGELARVAWEAVLAEDPELECAVDLARSRRWRRLARD